MIFHFLKDPVKRGWALVAIVGVLVVLLLAPFVYDADARHLSAYENGDEEAALARQALGSRAASVESFLSTPHALADIREPQFTLFVILGNERRYSESETQAVLDFLERGGNVLLADEGGYGSDIAREAGLAFHGKALLDTRNHRGDPTLATSTARLGANETFRILFNAPSAIVVLDDAATFDIIAESSVATYPEGSYLDVNENGEIDRDDPAADQGEGFPLIVSTTYGQGKLVLVADTGLFMNGQLKVGEFDNDDFIGALAARMLGRADGRVLIDEGRHAPSPLLAPYDNSVRALGKLTSGLFPPLLTFSAIVLLGFAAWRSTRETEDWSHHEHNLGVEVRVPDEVRPDLGRAQRMARRRISERFNIPLEQVAAMTAEELLRLTGDRLLSEAAAGTLKSDPAALFPTFTTEASST